MPNDYPAAAYPDTWQILGVRLHPFSLGHYLKLRRLGCAFVADEEAEATVGDLLMGVMVCGLSSHPDPQKDEFWQWFNRPCRWWQNVLPRIFGTLTPAERVILRWGRRCRGVDMIDRCRKFQAYLTDQTRFPEYWSERQNDRSSGAHWSHGVLSTLVSRCGYTQEEAYNVPLAKALQDFFKWAENEGHVTLMSQEESEVTNGGL